MIKKVDFKKKIELLIKIVKDFVNEKIKVNDFVDDYEELYSYLFLDNEDITLNHISKNKADIFDEIHAEINSFEPNKNYRKEHSSYTDEKTFRSNIKKILSQNKS